jgi:hypothetical protein
MGWGGGVAVLMNLREKTSGVCGVCVTARRAVRGVAGNIVMQNAELTNPEEIGEGGEARRRWGFKVRYGANLSSAELCARFIGKNSIYY